ncbi:hypothetical protein V1511DRAFT_464261 [Dipodascopsis uninucleata]
MFTIQVVASPTSDVESSILQLDFNGNKYLFGRVSEGTQRVFVENGVRISRIRQIFLSGQSNWSSQMSGLPGMLLTLADQGGSYFRIYGDENLAWSMATLRHAIFRQQMQLQLCAAKTDMVNEFFTVRPVEVPGSVSAEKEDIAQRSARAETVVKKMFPCNATLSSPVNAAAEEHELDEIGHASKLFSANTFLTIPDERVASEAPSLCYIIQPHPVRGKFQASKAIELGVPIGPAFRKLTEGVPFRFPDGSVVTPEMVLEPQIRMKRIIILDIPEEDYVDRTTRINWFTMVSDPQAKAPGEATDVHLTTSLAENQAVGLVFHILGKNVDPFSDRYVAFMKSFGPDCEHIISHPQYMPDSLNFIRAAKLNFSLRLVSPRNFSKLHVSSASKQIPLQYKLENKKSELKVAPSLTGIHYRIKAEDVQSNIDDVLNKSKTTDIDQVERELQNDVLEKAPALKRKIARAQYKYQTYMNRLENGSHNTDAMTKGYESSNDSESESSESESMKFNESHIFGDVEFISLGTGSALPSVYRNVSGTIVRVPFYNDDVSYSHVKSVLFDCGESTYFNIRRLYGPVKCNELLREVKCVFISHLHADHHLGLLSFIQRRIAAFGVESPEPLFIISPIQIKSFLDEWGQSIPEINSDTVRFIDCRMLRPGNNLPFSTGNFISVFSELSSVLKLRSITTARAIHCQNSYSVALTFENGFKVSYSGDTRPNKEFVDIGLGTTLLIHEATMDDSLVLDAQKKRHSTLSEALGIARCMSARYVLLTHFSQRYPRLPKYSCVSAKERLAGIHSLQEDSHGRFLKSSIGVDIVADESWNQRLKLAMGYDGMTMKLREMGKQGSWNDVVSFLFGTVFKEESLQESDSDTVSTNSKPKKLRIPSTPKRKRKGSNIVSE